MSEEQIVKAIEGGAKSLPDIQEETGACTGDRCKELNPSGKCCSSDIIQLIKNNNSNSEFSCIG